MKTILKVCALSSVVLFGADSAFAAFPTSVVGTWNALLNQTSTTIVISTQGTTGACRTITGTIQGTTNLRGFYCRATGRIFFLRTNFTTNDTSQVYSGQLASDICCTNRMAGTFADVIANAELGWSAAEPSGP